MHLLMSLLIKLGFLSVFVSSWAYAEAIPMALREGNTRFLSRSLGSACYTMDSVSRGLPCNPAAVAKDHQAHFDADLLLGSNSEYLKEADDILHGHSDENAVAKFFSHRESVEGELSIAGSVQAPTWGLAFEPYRLIAVTRVQNSALPMIDLVIAEEQSVKGQIASYFKDNFYAGIQARYTHVRFIGQYFALSEAFAGGSADLFTPETQELLYFEPGVLYAWEELAWQPQISAVLAQWGLTDHKTDPYPIQPEGLIGASIKPLVPLGLLELGLQLQVNSETKNFRDAYRFAVAYQLGILQAVLGTSDNDRSAGFLVEYKSFSSGLSYWNQKESQSVFINFGFTL